MSELDALCQNPAPPPIFSGEPIVIEQFRVRQLTEASQKLTAIFAGVTLTKLEGDDVLSVLIERVDEAVAFLSLATGKTEDWIGDLSSDDFFRLFAEVQRVNHDFFFLTLRRLAVAAHAAGSAGPKLSNGSSPTATTSGPSPAIPSASSEATSGPAEGWSEDDIESGWA